LTCGRDFERGDFTTLPLRSLGLTRGFCAGINITMTPELQRALKSHMQWLGSYKKSGELVKVQVWLIVNRGRIEFLTAKNSYKVRRLRRNSRAICYVGSKNGPAVGGTAQIVSEKAELRRVYRAYWKTHPVFMLLGIGLRIWIEMLLSNRVVVRVVPDEPNPLAGVNE
jgi:Pyridoxamine 5'-phosphate oxidase